MSDDGIGPVELRAVSVMEESEGMTLQPGAVATSLGELRDMFFGAHPLLRYDLVVDATNPRGAELKARSWARAKNPFNPSFIGVGRVRKQPRSGLRGKYNVTINVRG